MLARVRGAPSARTDRPGSATHRPPHPRAAVARRVLLAGSTLSKERVMRRIAVFLLAAACGTNLTPSLVNVGGRVVELVETGAGDATVVFESGLGDDWSPWDEV